MPCNLNKPTSEAPKCSFNGVNTPFLIHFWVVEVVHHLHRSPGSWTCSSQPALCFHQTSPQPAWSPHLGSSPGASSCSQSLTGVPPASSGGAETGQTRRWVKKNPIYLIFNHSKTSDMLSDSPEREIYMCVVCDHGGLFTNHLFEMSYKYLDQISWSHTGYYTICAVSKWERDNIKLWKCWQISCRAAYRDLFEVFVLEILQGIHKVLFDVNVQGVLHISHLPHGLAHVHQSAACRTHTDTHMLLLDGGSLLISLSF